MSRQTQPVLSRAEQRTRPPLPLQIWGATDKGLQREGNEDSIFPESGAEFLTLTSDMLARKGQLLVVADGMGGTRAGSEASRWAIRVAVERYYDMPERDVGSNLRTVVEIANNSLYQYLQSTNASEGGCTMTAAVIHRNLLYVTNVGDSRAYLIRAGKIRQLTHDHTVTQQKIDQGVITLDQAATDPARHVITRSMGRKPEVRVDLFPPVPLNDGDVVLLCSDGLTDMLSDEEVRALLAGVPPKRAVRRLIEAANKRGGVDNISVVVVQVGGHGAPRAAAQPKSGARAAGHSGLSAPQITLLAVLAVAVFVLFSILGWLVSGGFPQRPTLSPVTDPTTPAISSSVAPDVTLSPTATPAPSATPETGSSIRPTSTLVPTSIPTATPRPQITPSVAPTAAAGSTVRLLKPDNGLSYQNPLQFSWEGELRTGQQYRLVLRHESGYQEFHLVSVPSARLDLPADKAGGWTWWVQVLSGEQVLTQSDSWGFWFVPMKPQPTSPGGATPTATLPPR